MKKQLRLQKNAELLAKNDEFAKYLIAKIKKNQINDSTNQQQFNAVMEDLQTVERTIHFKDKIRLYQTILPALKLIFDNVRNSTEINATATGSVTITFFQILCLESLQKFEH